VSYSYAIRLFERFGVELEYMIVDRKTLDVRPMADELLKMVSGDYSGDAEPDGPDGPVSWSNELALHVVELKTARPAEDIMPLAEFFQDHVRRINGLLAPKGACLLPTAMHPWMDPNREMKLWPHEYNIVYDAFDRTFGCKGHGWANLQSAHLNLPFGSDEEFGRLHAAIRLVLPLIPALAASSPVTDGAVTGLADSRVDVYRTNARRVPAVAGMVIPEPVFTRADYQNKLLGSVYAALSPFDPEGVLRFEWANARGCIARFDRGAIEIRLVDLQEHPAADLAVARLIAQVVRALAEERLSDGMTQRGFQPEPLRDILLDCVHRGERAEITDGAYLAAMGFDEARLPAGEVWRRLAGRVLGVADHAHPWLRVIFQKGTLASRIIAATGTRPTREKLRSVYQELAECLHEGRAFGG
jgi:gamma-glutamyl:cysteine ligase YbdK (ATP-grasp superfamily)